MHLYDKTTHRSSVFALYRALLRHSRSRNITISPSHPEHTKYSLDPQLYLSYLRSEWKYSLRSEFENHFSDTRRFVKAFLRGVEIDQKLLESEMKGDTLTDVMQQYRKHKFKEQKWRANYLQNIEAIKRQEEKSMNELELRKLQSKIKKPVDPRLLYNKLGASKKHKVVEAELKKSKEFSDHLLRRYLKIKQQNCQLPNPSMLPHTPEAKEVPDYKGSYALPGSTKHDAIYSGYDKEYIDAIVKPSLEYDINKYHHLESLRHIVNEKGPYQVKIATTSAGPIPMPYIKSPLPRKEQMKEIALDTKKSWTRIRIRNVWVSEPGTIKDEKVYSDGRYSIPRSRGFGPEEFIYPRSYYQKLAEGEALWEYILGCEAGDPKGFSSYLEDWTEHLDINTQVLEAKVDHYYSKYSEMRNKGSSLFQERDKIQKQMNTHYDHLVATYDAVINKLNSEEVFKHSELVSPTRVEKSYDQILRSTPISKAGDGIPESERKGMGKRLGDYLQDAKIPNFQWGKKFYKRFKFDLKNT